MSPKVENALAAIDAGVKEVIITLATAIDGKHGTDVYKRQILSCQEWLRNPSRAVPAARCLQR